MRRGRPCGEENRRMVSGRVWARAAGVAMLAVFLVACDDEPAERKAFITFLQTRIIDKQGLRVPHLSDDEAKSIGPYAKQYAIITDFNDGLDRSVAKPMAAAIERGAVHSLSEVVTRHADFVVVRDGVALLRGTVEAQLAKADAAHAALKQPDDLKPVFDEAYERDVTLPAQAFTDICPDLSEELAAIVDLGDFLEQHKDVIKINGAAVESSDPSLQPHLAALVHALTAKNEAIVRAQQHLRDVMNGT
jgi:hypothetical protein